MKFSVGEMAIVKETITHDTGRIGQPVVIFKTEVWHDGTEYYYAVGFQPTAGRFWGCGFKADELEGLGYKLDGLVDSYASWLTDGCWKNTDHTDFNHFMKKLKKIRKKYKRKVAKRCD